ncbi:MAG: mechanosensitive ion channel family protein, partial [Cryomorphaceae bacterium]
AGGILILILKPFKVGDYIDDGTNAGHVREIQIFYTYVTTFRNEEIIIPNGKLSNNAVKNSTYHDKRRLDMLFGISYGDDMNKAIGLLHDLVKADDRILTDPASVIFVETLNNSSVDIKVRMWTAIENYWAVYIDMTGKVKATFDENDITIPFPQRDVHMRQVN